MLWLITIKKQEQIIYPTEIANLHDYLKIRSEAQLELSCSHVSAPIHSLWTKPLQLSIMPKEHRVLKNKYKRIISQLEQNVLDAEKCSVPKKYMRIRTKYT